MKFWWLVDMHRIAIEREAVGALAAEGWWSVDRWRVSDHRLCVEGTVTAGGKPFAVRLVYPDQYPLVPCWVEPQEGTERWSAHQYGDGGSLCLELRPDNWTDKASGADMLRSAWHLLEAEVAGEGALVPSAHHVGAIQRFNLGRMSVLAGAGCVERILAGAATGLAAHRWPARDGFTPVYLSDDADKASGRAPPEGIATPLGVFVFDIDPASLNAIGTLKDLLGVGAGGVALASPGGFVAIARSGGVLDAFH